MMLWCVISMAFFRRMTAWNVVSRMNIMLPGQRPLVVPSAVVQARQRLGSEAVRQVFDLTQKSWHEVASQRQQTTHSRCFISYLPSHELLPHRPAHLEETAKTLTSE
jgi:hypothetical protein